MKRDMDLIRNILLVIELSDDDYGVSSEEVEASLTGYTTGQISYHLALLIDAGWIEAKAIAGGFGGPDAYNGVNLRWDGQEFLSATKDNALWKKAKEVVINSGAAFTVQSLLTWLKAHV